MIMRKQLDGIKNLFTFTSIQTVKMRKNTSQIKKTKMSGFFYLSCELLIMLNLKNIKLLTNKILPGQSIRRSEYPKSGNITMMVTHKIKPVNITPTQKYYFHVMDSLVTVTNKFPVKKFRNTHAQYTLKKTFLFQPRP
jgi:hypothetical protein